MKATENMLNLAAQFNFFAPDSIPAMYFEDEHFKTDFEYKNDCKYWRIKNIPDFLLNSELFEVGEFLEIREQNKNFSDDHELYYIESYHILVYCKGANNLMLLKKIYDKDIYTLFPIFNIVNKITKKLSSSQIYEYTKKVIAPKKIGTFTEKKVLNWVNYCNEYITALEQCGAYIESKKAENQLKIDSTINSLPDCKVSRWHNSTIIETKLFSIEFKLENNGEYLNQKIFYKGGLKEIIEKQL